MNLPAIPARKIGQLVTLVIAAYTVGCATQSPTLAQLKPARADQIKPRTDSINPEAATITVIRDVGANFQFLSFHIDVDGTEVVALDEGQWFTFKVEPGEHQFGVWPANALNHDVKRVAVDAEVKPRARTVYRVGSGASIWGAPYIQRDPTATAPK